MNIAVLLPTYGRPKLVSNAVGCFVAQTYPADKCRLLCLDDGNQTHGEGPNWRIVKEVDRYPNMMPKYNRMVELLNQWWPEWDAIVLQDDDDIYGPTWLESHAWALERRPWSYPSHVWSLYGSKIHKGEMPVMEESGGRFWASTGITRKLFANIGGFGCGEEKDFDLRFLGKMRTFGGAPANPIDQSMLPQYCYGWGRSNHLSSLTGNPHWYLLHRKQDDRTCPFPTVPELDMDTKLLYERVWYSKPSFPAVPMQFGTKHTRFDIPRVLILSSALMLGGAEEWIRQLVELVPNVNFIGIALPRTATGLTHRANEFRKWLPVFFMDERPDLVQSANVYLCWGQGASALPTPKGRPKVFVSHGEDLAWTRTAVVQGVNLTHWAAVAEVATKCLVEEKKSPIKVIDNAIDLTRLVPLRPKKQARDLLGIPTDKKIIMYVGRNSSEKGSLQFRKMSELLSDDWMAVAIGYLCDTLPATDHFLGLPYHNDRAAIYGAADVLCSMSITEGFGLANIEGLWCGLPLLSMPVGVLSDLPKEALWFRMTPDQSLPAWAAMIPYTLFHKNKDQQEKGWRVNLVRTYIEDHWGSSTFAKEWSEYLNTVAREGIL